MSSKIQKLVCRNFRSYRTLALNFSSKFVVFYGENGAGKTNILEAISLFSPERGLRKAPISDLTSLSAIPFSWSIDLSTERDDLKTFLSTYVQNGRRVAKVDDSPMTSLSKFEDFLWILWVIPSMNNIFIDSASVRRSFFDHLVSVCNHRHKSNIKKLVDLQKERLHVILFRKDERWLQVLEEKIAEKNVEIAKSRLEFIDVLHETFQLYPSKFLRPKIGISGAVEDVFSRCREEDAVLEIASMLKNDRYEDVETQVTSISTQRSIWQTRHEETAISAENCSTGEQKAFLISLVLAVARIFKKRRIGVPVLLLDDLMVHLDASRRTDLLDELIDIDVQTFFTGTDLSFFEHILDIAQIYHVNDSICYPEKHRSNGAISD